MPETPPETVPEQGRRETGRAEAFSDGVFAIAVTLLVLTIPVTRSLPPHTTLARAVLDQWPNLAAYGISFLTILVMWINHHSIFGFIVSIDRPFLVINGLLLLFITFINFPTTLVAGFPGDRFAAGLYSATMAVIAVCYNVLWKYAVGSGRLAAATADRRAIAAITRQYRYGVPLYLVALALALFSGWASMGVNFGLAVYFAFTGFVGRNERAAMTASPEARE